MERPSAVAAHPRPRALPWCEAIRNLTAQTPSGDYVTFEQMHAEYERRRGVKIDIAAEAEKLSRPRKNKRG